MMRDIKLGFRLLRYGLNVNSSLIVGVLFLIISFLADVIGYVSFIGTTYAGIVVILFGQLLHSVVQSNMVQSSPQKKKLVTKVPALVMTVVMLVYHTCMVALKCVRAYDSPEEESMIAYGIMLGGITVLIMQLYFAFAMKVYWPATILFFAVFYAFFFNASLSGTSFMFEERFGIALDIPMVAAVAISYGCILIGYAANYGINVWLYNRDYAQQNFKKVLDRAK